MSQKRQQHDDPGKPLPEASSDAGRRKRPSFRNVVREVIKYCTIHKYVEPILEPLIRKVVKEEVELALKRHMRTIVWDCGNEKESSISRSLQLQFLSRLSLPVFTGTRIEGGDCNTLKVALTDAHSGKTVSNGLESSAKVEIVVLEGDFDDDVGDDWTLEEFNANIVRERRGKKTLLNGNALMNLNEGIGLVSDLFFTDNSSWTRSRKFRLGARIVDNCNGIRVREAKSESFIVRDRRGELYKKHHPPYLSDEVWRLEKISKDGAFHKRLNSEKVKTVKDFLVIFFLDSERLRHILGSGMSAKMWEVTVDHARNCVLDDNKLYLYCPQAQKRDGVIFNVVGQVLGLLSDCKYVVADTLSETDKAEANKLVISALQHSDEIVAYDDESTLRNGTCLLTEDLYPSNAQMGNPKLNKTKSSHKKSRFDYPQLSSPSPDVVSLGEYGSTDMSSIDVRFDHEPFNFQCQVEDALMISDPGYLKPHDKPLQYFGVSSQADLHFITDGVLFPHSDIGKAQRRWRVVSSVVKWLSLMLEIRGREIIRCSNFG